ncbi:SDR family NAD(P)-dependent oxidoreductase [Sphingomonas tabacisoli]|uniref:SDR family NAD(P)-dependent oxidoreductase n=1 Tax=Sphingomonas tabacisoli TaxID=2249466 RepID=A0ABW4I5L6_9SPHN
MRLSGKVALVTGASRGIGKGVALALAGEGATVYVTGRSAEGGGELGGTIGETADACTRRGGRGIAVRCDHAQDEEVAALFARIAQEQGQLDLLVNNAFAIPDDLIEAGGFWEKPLSQLQMIDVGLRSNFTAAWHAARMMVPQGSGLIVAISGYVGVTYTYGALFGTVKSGVDRMARDMAIELKPHGVASISLWQGLTLTERAQRNIAANAAMMKSVVTNPTIGCSPEFPGRVIAGLLADDAVMRLSGGTFIAAELAAEYGIVDIDGRTIPSLREQRGAPLWHPV